MTFTNLEQKVLMIGHVSPITPEDQELFNRFFQAELELERYANSWTYITQACRELGKFGYKYFFRDHLIAIGVHRDHYAIVNPQGENAGTVTAELCRQLYYLSQKPVYVKHLNERHHTALGTSFNDMNKYPWEETAPYDDATYPEVIVCSDDFVNLNNSCYAKYRARLNRFLNKQFHHCSIEEYDSKKQATKVRQLLKQWSREEVTKMTPYENMIECPSSSGFNYITLFNKQVIAFHVLERIGFVTAALYADIVNYREFKGASEACLLLVAAEVQKYNVKKINLGGSETASLHAYKKKFPAGEIRPTTQNHFVYSEKL